jgi:hypothetical protein
MLIFNETGIPLVDTSVQIFFSIVKKKATETG